MKVRLLFAAAVLLASAVCAGAQEEGRLLRFPATNGTDIVFSYAGDLWTVPVSGGEARRLTSHIGYEAFARYSPDGRSIAFTGEYDGNREVYLIPAGGGDPRRLTWTSTNPRDDLGDRMGPNNIVLTWKPDGSGILFRNRIGDGFEGQLWCISPDGGMPVRLPLPEGGFCSWSPDGKRLAYNRVMREFRTWKYYRGGMADDVWIWDPKAKTVVNVTNNDAQDIFPMWIGNEIFFASDRDMTMNLFCYNVKTGATEKVTDFSDFDIKFPSTDGRTIVFEQGGWIYRFNPADRSCAKVPIVIGTDNVYARTERRAVGKNITSAAMSPDGSRLVVTARGEVFDIPASKGVTRNISRTPGSNDRSADWSPDGKYIAWIGDGTGETEVYLYDVASGETRQLTSGTDTYIRSLQWTPDSKTILYTDRKNRLVEVGIPGGSRRTLLQNPEAEFRGVSISPDGKWLTYTRPAPNEMDVVYVFNIADGKEYPVTERWYNSSSPVFSSDGKYLIFSSDRDIDPQYSRIEWNFTLGNMGSAYMAMLAADTPSPLLPKDGVDEAPGKGPAPKAEAEAKADGKKAGKKPDGKKADDGAKTGEAPAVTVRIDPDGIFARIVKLPFGGRNFYCDGKKIWHSEWGGGTRVFDLATGKDDECVKGFVRYRNGDKKAIVRERGGLSVARLDGKMKGDPVPVDDVVALIDYRQEWPQIFDEVWRAFRDGYYLENMHGRDWKAIKEKYAALVPYVRTRLDLNYVIGEMISELASGHAYVSPGEYPKPERIPMGLLGAEISRTSDGWFRIDRILEGAPYSESLRSPLAEPGLGIKAGEYITAVDGVSVKGIDNIYRLLVGKAGVLTELTVSAKPAAGGRKVVVKPTSDEYPLYHYEWVHTNIRTVDKLSGGKVGYIYVPDMGPEGLSEFARYYYPQLDKEALIIDDRANGGGNVSPMLIERLKREVYRMTMSRTSSMTGTVPDGTHTGPKVLLINKYSASDGDLFPGSFKANNLGTVIGTRTWGGIVGISGPLPYMDGTDVRVPFFTNYDRKTGQWIVENHGVDPDILIDNDPVKEFAGIDQQLEKAVEVALEQLKDRVPLPPVPAPRTFKDLGLPQLP